jgi:antiviral helicase SKI2
MHVVYLCRYTKAIDAVKLRKASPAMRGGGAGGHGMGQRNDKNIFITLINHLSTADLLPVVVFTFSRKRCDDNAAMLLSVDLTTDIEKRHIHTFFTRCTHRLAEVDRELPQVKQMFSLCTRGLAVHHSGVLPLLKEVVEMLFADGHIKVWSGRQLCLFIRPGFICHRNICNGREHAGTYSCV